MFTHPYLMFDEFGLHTVRCMACAANIKTREEVTTKSGKTIREIAKHADYKEIPVILEGGKMAFIMVCDNCKFVAIGDLEAKNITEQLGNALKMQLEYEGKLPDFIEEYSKVNHHVVLRKAEVSEITAALRGV